MLLCRSGALLELPASAWKPTVFVFESEAIPLLGKQVCVCVCVSGWGGGGGGVEACIMCVIGIVAPHLFLLQLILDFSSVKPLLVSRVERENVRV